MTRRKSGTEAHRREAFVCLLRENERLALAATDQEISRWGTVEVEMRDTQSEAALSDALEVLGVPISRVSVLLWRVDGLATGRLVRETVWFVVTHGGVRVEQHRALGNARASWRAWQAQAAPPWPYRILRVTRIRRPS